MIPACFRPFARLLRICFLTTLVALAPGWARAQAAATGIIEGRVINPATGDYLETARITLEGTGLEAFTDSAGQYRLVNAPAGSARLKVFHTAIVPQVQAVTVEPGRTTTQDFNVASFRGARDAASPVKLDQFVVATAREMTGAAIAINTQRFAPNVMTIVAADEFGTIADGNVGELLKFLPGITAEFNSGEPRQIGMNGTPSANLPVTVNGFGLASAQASTTRAVELYSVSTNNLSRIEVVYSPTPESPGSALAGSVNMVTQSAFDRAKPVFNGSVFLFLRDNARDFKKTAAPNNKLTRKINPGFDCTYLVPVNKRFGFTFSASRSEQYQNSDGLGTTWRGVSGATNGTTLPDTTPDQPYLTDFTVRDGPRTESRSSFGGTLDYKFGPNDRISLSLHRVDFGAEFHNHTLAFFVNNVPNRDFSLTHTRGAVGAGEVRLTNGERHRAGSSLTPTLTYRHTGPIWKAEAGLGHSQANTAFRDLGKGFFSSSVARRTGVTVSFADITYYRPGRITVTDATGAPVDYTNLASYALSTANSIESDSYDVQRTAYGNLTRDFTWRVPFTLKAGVDLRHSQRDLRGLTSPYNFVGANGTPSTTPLGNDDSAAVVLDEIFSTRTPGFGFPRVQWVDNAELLDLHRRNPTYVALDQNGAYRNSVNLSKHAEELVSSFYLRGNVAFLERRLKITTGVRAEQTNVKAEGPLTDPTRNFQRDASGNLRLAANGQPIAISTAPLEVAQRTLFDRGLRSEKEYLRFFPSLNASYNLRENLIARGAHYWSLGRPDFNQYAGGLTLPANVEAAPSATNRISVNNAAIKAWSAKTNKLTLEYYFEGVGLVSVAAFRRDFENFFGSTVFNATPAFLALYGLDPAIYDPFDVATTQNIQSTVRMEGVDFNYKQALTFLPAWARGVQVFANGSTLHAKGDATANFAGYAPRTANWGVSLTRERFNVKLNWNYRSRLRLAKIPDGRSIDPNTYNWSSSRLYLNIAVDLQLRKHWALFANLRNFTAVTEDLETVNPFTPAHAQLRSRDDFGSLWSLGVKATF